MQAAFLKTLTTSPGVYQMINAKGEVLYVGKARHLKKRVSSYFRSQVSIKTASLVKQIAKIEVIVTQTENEALLLENTLIKKYLPRYNILFRDDKSYPYIIITSHADYPRLEFYRGIKKKQIRYFGPYPSTTTVRETLNLLQKIFRLRSCQDDFFKSRTRPCLQYQIKRCTAPCVNLISVDAYQQDVKRAELFLSGKNQELIQDLVVRMEEAANQLQFETAARFRDQIASLRQIQQQQAAITSVTEGDVDAIAIVLRSAVACVQVMTIRGGRLLGGRSYFPSAPPESTLQEILSAFIAQYYLSADSIHEIPKQILVSHKLEDQQWLISTLSQQSPRDVHLTHNARGQRARWLQIAMRNALENLSSHLASKASVERRLIALQKLLGLDNIPQRIECFDISHSQGEATVASCVVFDEQGPRKNDYRRFNIENITPGDDYAALHQALFRRYIRVKTEEGKLPDILIIDGGKGQLAQGEKALEELQISGITLMSIAKGPGRKAGLETLYVSGYEQPLPALADSMALHLLQQIRDEAHRFAIMGHRGQRAKLRQTSTLEKIPGIGSKRRRDLLQQFGGLQELKRASIQDLTRIPGISIALAERIYKALHD